MPFTILFNATNAQSGGALQVAHSLLSEWSRLPNIHLVVAQSPQLAQSMNVQKHPESLTCIAFRENPTKGVRAMRRNARLLDAVAKSHHCNVVFTVFGPAWWKPRLPHLCGFANGFYLYPNSYFIKERVCKKMRERMKYHARRALLFRQLRSEAQCFWVETRHAQKALAETLKIDHQNIVVAGNTFGFAFAKQIPAQRPSDGTFTLIVPAAYYPHKQLELLPKLCQLLQHKGHAVRFLLTLPEATFDKVLAPYRLPQLKNLGVIAPQDFPAAYSACDAVFLPSLLEIFSSVYPEAMQMQKPILTSKLWFATDICGAAALYFDPLNPEEIAHCIIRLMHEKGLVNELIDKGIERLKALPDAASRAQVLLAQLKKINLS